MTEDELLAVLVVGARIRLGPKYCKHSHLFKAGQVITLVEGVFERDNGLYDIEEYAPSVFVEVDREYNSIFHLFDNNLENFLDCEVLDGEN